MAKGLGSDFRLWGGSEGLHVSNSLNSLKGVIEGSIGFYKVI